MKNLKMSTSIIPLISMIVWSISASALTSEISTINVVRNGKAEHAVITSQSYFTKNGTLNIHGPGEYVSSGYALKPGMPFAVSAKIALKLHGTAAALTINGNNIGFDGRDYKIFYEGADLSDGQLHYLPESPIRSDIPFKLEAKYDGRILSLKIDGKQVLSEELILNRKAVISLRPHRANLKIYEFSVSGQPDSPVSIPDILEKSPPRGPTVRVCSVEHDAAITFPLHGNWCAYLEKSAGMLAVSNVKNGITITVPAKKLREAYSRSRGRYNLKSVKIILKEDTRKLTKRLLCYDPDKIHGFRAASVKMIGGTPSVSVGGRDDGILRGYLAVLHHRYRKSDGRKFNRAGIKESNICLIPRLFYSRGKFNHQAFFDYIETQAIRIIRDNPDNTISLRWNLYISKDWGREHPEELIVTDPKTSHFRHPRNVQASYASELWRKHNLEIIDKTLNKIKHSPIADRLVCVRVGYGNCGEWNNFGYHEKVFPDLSPPMQKAFAVWLTKKYKTDARLQEAWGQNSVFLKSQYLVPGKNARITGSNNIFRTLPNGKQVADFYEFWQGYTVSTIEVFARKIKEISDNKLLVGAFYGYFIGHLSNAPYHFQDSGHYALGAFLRSPYLDFASGPYPYYSRRINAAVNSAFSSYKLHNKFWYSENDQATHVSGDKFKRYGAARTIEEAIGLAKRNFMQNLAKGCSYYYFDFVLGWFKDEKLMRTIKQLKAIDKFALNNGRESIAEVAVLLDEKVVPVISNESAPAMKILRRMLGQSLDTAGAPWDCYLLSDLENIDFSQYKLVILANAYKLDPVRRASIKKILYNNDRAILFLYIPGCIDRYGKINFNVAKELCGMDFSLLTGVKKFNFQPVLTASGPGAKRIQMFKNKKAAIAMKQYKGYKLLFATSPGLDEISLSNKIYANTSVHRYIEPGDVFLASGKILSVYSRKGGRKKVSLPRKVEVVYDFFSGRVIASDCQDFYLDMPTRPSCYILYAGPRNKIKDSMGRLKD